MKIPQNLNQNNALVQIVVCQLITAVILSAVSTQFTSAKRKKKKTRNHSVGTKPEEAVMQENANSN